MSGNCWVKIERLISETQMSLQPKQDKQFSDYFPSASRCLPLAGTQGLKTQNGLQGEKAQQPQSSLFFILLQLLLMNILYDIEYFVGSVWVSCPICVPSQPILQGKKTPLLCASTVAEWPNQSVLLTLFQSCTQDSTIQDAINEVNSFLVR